MRRFFYDTHAQLRAHLDAFVGAYNFAKRLKTLKGLTPFEFIVQQWTNEPDRFTKHPNHLSTSIYRVFCFERAESWFDRSAHSVFGASLGVFCPIGRVHLLCRVHFGDLDQPSHVVGEIGHADFGSRSRKADGSDR